MIGWWPFERVSLSHQLNNAPNKSIWRRVGRRFGSGGTLWPGQIKSIAPFSKHCWLIVGRWFGVRVIRIRRKRNIRKWICLFFQQNCTTGAILKWFIGPPTSWVVESFAEKLIEGAFGGPMQQCDCDVTAVEWQWMFGFNDKFYRATTVSRMRCVTTCRPP